LGQGSRRSDRVPVSDPERGLDHVHGDAAGSPAGRRSIGDAFAPRANSLNFLRLMMAVAVVFSHGIILGAFGSEYVLGHTTIGNVAVMGFFVISGFLIAGSAGRNGLGRYLWQRFLRIMPGFWVCLVVTAAVFGLVGWLVKGDPRGPQCGLDCYVTGPAGAVDYVTHNFFLWMGQYQIAGGPRGVPYPLAWDGSLWTLYYEFLCYLALGALAFVGVLRHRTLLLVVATAVWLTEAAVAVRLVSPGLNVDESSLLRLAPAFLVGAVVYVYRDRIPDSGWIALVCTAGFVSGLWWVAGGGSINGATVLAPLLAYPMLWLGIHLPFRSIGSRNDYSYGVYIYAFPVQQLLAIWGLQRWGYVPFVLLTLVGTAPFAVASWWLVERQALRHKGYTPSVLAPNPVKVPGLRRTSPLVKWVAYQLSPHPGVHSATRRHAHSRVRPHHRLGHPSLMADRARAAGAAGPVTLRRYPPEPVGAGAGGRGPSGSSTAVG